MARNYKKQPKEEKGEFKFLIFLIRYVYFGDTDKNMISIHQESVADIIDKKQPTIAGYINKAKKQGFIKVIEEGYFSEKQDYPSMIYDVNTKRIKDYLLENGINPFSDMKRARQQVIDYFKSLIKESDRERKERLKKNKVNKALKEYVHNYYNQIIVENNKRLIALGLKKFIDKYLNENRLRATNALCATKNPDNFKNDPTFSDTERYELLSEIGINNPVEFDVNGSIYRLTYNLMHETQLSQDIDIYKLFWENTGFIQPWSDEIRNHLKAICMPIYMKKQGIYTSVKWYKKIKKSNERMAEYYDKLTKNVIVKKGFKNIIIKPTKLEKRKYEAYDFLSNYLGLDIEVILNSIAESMLKVLSVEKFFARDIFLYESDLHAQMKSLFMDKGIMVLNCYDGFYVEKGELTEEEFLAVYAEATDELKRVIRIGDENQDLKQKEEIEDEEYDEYDYAEDFYDWVA